MPGPQTQHEGTVYGDDENAPKYLSYFSATTFGSFITPPPPTNISLFW